MKRIARIIIRGNEDDGQGNFGLVTMFNNQDLFKGNDVWEITEIMGELVLKKIGKTHFKNNPVNCGDTCWGHTINDILGREGKHLSLTEEEYASLVTSKQKGSEEE